MRQTDIKALQNAKITGIDRIETGITTGSKFKGYQYTFHVFPALGYKMKWAGHSGCYTVTLSENWVNSHSNSDFYAQIRPLIINTHQPVSVANATQQAIQQWEAKKKAYASFKKNDEVYIKQSPNPWVNVKPTTVTVPVSADLKAMQQGMIELSQAMSKAAKGMSENLAPAIKHMQDVIKAVGDQIPSSKWQFNDTPADYIGNHPEFGKEYKCPKKNCGNKATLWDLIQHLNDTHKWKLEAIADWLDTLDSQPVFYPAIENVETP